MTCSACRCVPTHRGTLFLDEIADAAPAAQGHLLHPLQDGAVRPLGEPRPAGWMSASWSPPIGAW